MVCVSIMRPVYFAMEHWKVGLMWQLIKKYYLTSKFFDDLLFHFYWCVCQSYDKCYNCCGLEGSSRCSNSFDIIAQKCQPDNGFKYFEKLKNTENG